MLPHLREPLRHLVYPDPPPVVLLRLERSGAGGAAADEAEAVLKHLAAASAAAERAHVGYRNLKRKQLLGTRFDAKMPLYLFPRPDRRRRPDLHPPFLLLPAQAGVGAAGVVYPNLKKQKIVAISTTEHFKVSVTWKWC